ncbi:hypothetical protein [Aquimarina sp. RZ0]|uniref:hypothetical protein n=1 Tax=Aquimarina sp. RZ0 TaxID=2607730 RepID=UPI0011F2B7CA|nr:hypothetical protein [Aquimarina sp. RZ0]KAA1243238.1 hypothetical protein F0000_21990 [Aquimarina sp. RZ0]
MGSINQSISTYKDTILTSSKSHITRTKLIKPITYANDNCIAIDKDNELDFFSYEDHAIVHADMPKIIRRRLWLQLYSKKHTRAIIKCPTKNGNYTWLLIDIESNLDMCGEITSYLGRRRIIYCEDTIQEIEGLYKKLVSIEQAMSVGVAEKYFAELLLRKGKTYNQYLEAICPTTIKKNTVEQKVLDTYNSFDKKKNKKSMAVVTP